MQDVYPSRSKTVSRPLLRIVCKTGRDRRFSRVALTSVLAVVLLLSAAPSDAQPAVRQVLVLQSFARGNAPVDQFTANFRVELDQRVRRARERRSGRGGSDRVCRRVRTSGGRLHPIHVRRSSQAGSDRDDRRARRGLRAQVSTAALSRHAAPVRVRRSDSISRDAPLGDNETAVAVVNDYPRVIETVLQLLPQTRQVFMVVGSGPIGQFWRRELENEFRRFHDRLTFVWFDRSVPSGDPAPLCKPAGQLGDRVCHLRHGRHGGGVCGRTSVRRASRHGECTAVCAVQRVPGRRESSADRCCPSTTSVATRPTWPFDS